MIDFRLIDFKKRLILFIILTSEVGKPSNKFKNDFIYNFSDSIENGHWYISGDLKNTFNSILNNGDAVETDGGIDFYSGIKNNSNKDELVYYIDNYKKLTNSIEYIEPDVDKEVNDTVLIDYLRHSVKLKIEYDDISRGKANAEVIYDINDGQYTIKAGSILCKIETDSFRYGTYSWRIRKELEEQGLLKDMGNNQLQLTKDKKVKSLSAASTIILFRENSYANVYIKTKSDNKILLSDVLKECENGNFKRYKLLIEMQGDI